MPAEERNTDSHYLFAELIDEVIQFSADTPTLLSYCLVSRYCACIAHKMLYSSVALCSEDGVQDFRLGPERALKWHATITNNPKLARHLVSCSVYSLEESFWPLLAEVLHLASNLKILSLNIILPPEWTTHLLGGSFTFRLTSLFLISGNSPNDVLDRGLVRFLTVQSHSLRQLWLTANERTISSLPPGICPGIFVLGGSTLAIKCFLPSRSSIRYLSWIAVGGSAFDLSLSDFEMHHSFSSITYLLLKTIPSDDQPSLMRPLFSLLFPYLDRLEVLIFDGEYHKDDFELIPQLPRLEEFMLMCHDERYMLPKPLQAGIVRRWFALSGTLTTVYFLTNPLRPPRVEKIMWI